MSWRPKPHVSDRDSSSVCLAGGMCVDADFQSQLNKEVGTGDAVLTQIAMSSNQKLMFASTDHGALRAYRYPMVEDEYVVR